MSYETQAGLRTDPAFQSRVTSSLDEQALIFKDDARPEFVQLAENQLRGAGPMDAWMKVMSGSPGFADAPNQSAITDGQILAAVQAQWPMIAELYYLSPPEG